MKLLLKSITALLLLPILILASAIIWCLDWMMSRLI